MATTLVKNCTDLLASQWPPVCLEWTNTGEIEASDTVSTYVEECTIQQNSQWPHVCTQWTASGVMKITGLSSGGGGGSSGTTTIDTSEIAGVLTFGIGFAIFLSVFLGLIFYFKRQTILK